MSITTTRVGLIRTAVTAAGANLPKPVAQAVADHDKLAALTGAIPVVTAEQIEDAVADALLAGRDPLDDEHVRRLATSRALTGDRGQGIAYGVPLAAERRVVAALTAHADDILATLHAAADTASATLTAAHDILGDHDLGESELILRLGADAARAWAEARDAVQALRVIDRAWTALAELTRFAPASTDPTLRLADVTLEQYERVGRKAAPWDLVRAGAVIDLADRTTIRDRVTRITEARQTRQGQGERAFRSEYRRTRGTGGPITIDKALDALPN